MRHTHAPLTLTSRLTSAPKRALSSLSVALCAVALMSSALISTASAYDLSRETLGEVMIGTAFSNILRALGSPSSSSKVLHDEQQNCSAQVHFYEKRGVEVETCGEGRNPVVRSVRAVNNRTAITGRGVRVTDAGSEVLSRYVGARKVGDTIVIEDPLHGITMRFLLNAEGKIYEINLYRDHTLKGQVTPKIGETPKATYTW